MKVKIRLERAIPVGKSEELHFRHVDEKGNAEAVIKTIVSDPDFVGKFKAGAEFYVEFTPVEDTVVEKEPVDGSPDTEPPETDDGDDELDLDSGEEE